MTERSRRDHDRSRGVLSDGNIHDAHVTPIHDVMSSTWYGISNSLVTRFEDFKDEINVTMESKIMLKEALKANLIQQGVDECIWRSQDLLARYATPLHDTGPMSSVFHDL